MKLVNSLGLPQALVDAVTLEKHNAEGEISATTLIKGVKEYLLTERHWDDITVDVKDQIWALWGSTAHKLLEKEYEGTFTEEKFEQKVGNYTVTGRVDCYDMENEVLYDYKTTSAWKVVYKNFEDWKSQGLIYAWLLSKIGLNVKKCKFEAILRDWSETESLRKADYPKAPVYIYEFDVTEEDIKAIGEKIEQKVAKVEENLKVADDDIEPCSKEERWASEDVYAVMKEGRKSSIKNFDNLEDAEKLAGELGEKHYVETRPGVDKKCTKYCVCKEFCNYYREHYGTEELNAEKTE